MQSMLGTGNSRETAMRHSTNRHQWCSTPPSPPEFLSANPDQRVPSWDPSQSEIQNLKPKNQDSTSSSSNPSTFRKIQSEIRNPKSEIQEPTTNGAALATQQPPQQILIKVSQPNKSSPTEVSRENQPEWITAASKAHQQILIKVQTNQQTV